MSFIIYNIQKIVVDLFHIGWGKKRIEKAKTLT